MPVTVVALLLGHMAIPTIILWLLTVIAVHVCVPVSHSKSSDFPMAESAAKAGYNHLVLLLQ